VSLLTVEGLSKVFGGLRAVDDVSFQVGESQIIGLIGPNGAGKTTCFNLISGFIPPTTGKVLFKDQEITHMSANKIASLGMVRTFQHTSVFPDLTVYDNVLTGMHLQSIKQMKNAFFRRKEYLRNEALLSKEIWRILDLMNLSKNANVQAKNLPYGDQRRLEIAIALAAKPQLLLLDEPAAGMNDTESAILVSIIRSLKQEGLSILIVEHDMKVVMNLCDYIVVLDQGAKICEGTPESVRRNPQVIKVYLGVSEEAKEDSSYA
jgi:ABC-type branched-subunit amino acid transport system ATPase component